LIAAAAVLVPRRMRDDWKREWRAETRYRWEQLRRWRRDGARGRLDVIGRTGGAVVDAGALRLDELRRGLLLDLRQSARGLSRRPAYTAFVVLVTALGIGTTVVLFTVVDSVLLRPLPLPGPDRLVRLWETRPDDEGDREGPAPGNFQYWREHAGIFEGLASWYVGSVTLRDDGGARTLTSAQVSNDFFRTVGVAPWIGRGFTDAEVDRAVYDTSNTHRGEGPVVVLSQRLWRTAFAADPGVIGTTIELERKSWEVVGVMPPRYAMPQGDVDVWLPWSFAHERPKDQRYTQVLGRLLPGAGLPEAQARMDALALDMAERFPESNRGWGVRLEPLMEDVVGGSRAALWVLFGAVACVLLIACLNVAGLQLVRATARSHESAVRMALGSSRLRLVRQQLVEALALSAAGGVAGMLLSVWGLQLIRTHAATALPRLDELALHGRTALFAVLLTTLSGVVFGLAPAVIGSRAPLGDALRDDGARTTAGRPRQRVRSAFVVTQVALAVVLLAGAGLLARSLGRLVAVDPGFDPDRVLVLPVFLDGNGYDGPRSASYYRRLVEHLESIPGVESAGGATALPGSSLGPDFFRPVWREGRRRPPGQEWTADVRMATPGYFETLGIPLRAGRGFGPADHRESRRVILINESLAARHWPDEDPVGRELLLDYGPAGTRPYLVVGVVGDVRFYGLRSRPRPELYIPHEQRPYLIMNVAVRTHGDPEAMVDTVRRAVLDVDAAQPVHSIVPLRRLVGASIGRERLATSILVAFAAAALLLAATGVYGVLSYGVDRRRREIGIRIALGARAGDVRGMILRQGATLLLAGWVLGLAAALCLTRLLANLLYEVSPLDPLTLAGVSLLLIAAAAAASWLPARRAAAVAPLHALSRR
jgi:predicted permease